MSTGTQKRKSVPTQLDLGKLEPGGRQIQMQGERLVIRISRDSHPELYEIDKLNRRMRMMIRAYKRKSEMRDLVEFLAETEKGLQIILRNHLDAAIRQYLGSRPV